jgi:cell wall-associated NlpC family hydrolase
VAKDRPLLNAAVGLSLAGVIIHGLTSGGHGGEAGGGPASASVTAAHDSGARVRGHDAARAIAFARAQVGKPYAWGGPRWAPHAAVPDGYDCSSLMQWAWAAAGVLIPQTSEAQWAQLRHVPLAEARPGDLMFETAPAGGAPPGHVFMYLGWWHGQRWIIEALGTGYPVHIVPLSTHPDTWGSAARPAPKKARNTP